MNSIAHYLRESLRPFEAAGSLELVEDPGQGWVESLAVNYYLFDGRLECRPVRLIQPVLSSRTGVQNMGDEFASINLGVRSCLEQLVRNLMNRPNVRHSGVWPIPHGCEDRARFYALLRIGEREQFPVLFSLRFSHLLQHFELQLQTRHLPWDLPRMDDAKGVQVPHVHIERPLRLGHWEIQPLQAPTDPFEKVRQTLEKEAQRTKSFWALAGEKKWERLAEFVGNVDWPGDKPAAAQPPEAIPEPAPEQDPPGSTWRTRPGLL